MEMDWKDNCAEMFGSLALTYLLLVLWAGAGDLGMIEWALALAVLWTAFSGADLIPALTVSRMLNDQDWESGGMKVLFQVLGAAGAGVLALVATQGDATMVAYSGPTEMATELTHWVTVIVGGGLTYTVWTRCEGLYQAGGVGLAAAAGMGAVFTGGAHVGTMLIGLADDGSFELMGLAMFIANAVAFGAGAWMATRVEAELAK